MKKIYEIRTFGFKNNYTCVLYKLLKYGQLKEMKVSEYKTETMQKAYKKFLKENKLNNSIQKIER